VKYLFNQALETVIYMTEDKVTISKSKLEKIIEQKVDQRLQEKEKTETKTKDKNKSEKIDRRQFIKKAGLGTAGLAALGLAPASALNINTDQLSVNTGSDTGSLTENLIVDTDGNVEIPNGNIQIDTGQSIEDGDGNRRIGFFDGISSLYAEGNSDNIFSARENEESQIRTNEGLILDDRHGGFTALEYQTSSSAPGTLELSNADLDLTNNAFDVGSFRFRADDGTLVIEDDEVELIRQDEQGTTQFIQGIDAGPVEAPEDTFSQIINTPVTSDTDSGTVVGHTFSVNNQTAIAIKAETDGSGGIESLEYEFYGSEGGKLMEIDNDGNVRAKGQFQDDSL